MFDLFFRRISAVAGQGWQSGHRDPVGVVHIAIAVVVAAAVTSGFGSRIRRTSGFQLFKHGHEIDEHVTPAAHVPAMLDHGLAVVLAVRVHGHVAQPVDQHVQKPDVRSPTGAHLDDDEVAGSDRSPAQYGAEIVQVARLHRHRTLGDVLVVHLSGDEQQVFV